MRDIEIINNINTWIFKNDFKAMDEFLEQIDLQHSSIELIVKIISLTSPICDNLKNRKLFYENAMYELEHYRKAWDWVNKINCGDI